MIRATAVGTPGNRTQRLTSMPSPATLASASSAMASSPTAPIYRVVAPNRAAAHAWLALLPPPDRVSVPLTTVSPGRGSFATWTVRSTLIDPTTTTQPLIVASP